MEFRGTLCPSGRPYVTTKKAISSTEMAFLLAWGTRWGTVSLIRYHPALCSQFGVQLAYLLQYPLARCRHHLAELAGAGPHLPSFLRTKLVNKVGETAVATLEKGAGLAQTLAQSLTLALDLLFWSG